MIYYLKQMLEIQKILPLQVSSHEIRNGDKNKLFSSDRRFHDWYRFVLSFPPQLVRQYIDEFKLGRDDLVLDPFCGTGTTLVESKLQNVPSIGIEANNFAYFASSTKINWRVDPKRLLV
jgi:tRNA G10  N-methylase Trm11